MTIQGYPFFAKLPEDLGLGGRFWYWRGASGRTYIHSIYAADSCPPLPGAVYVCVRRRGAERHATAVGRFSSVLEAGGCLMRGGLDCDEIHVHLLARDGDAADNVCRDLLCALRLKQDAGPIFAGRAQPLLEAA